MSIECLVRVIESVSYLYCCFSAFVIPLTARGSVANNTAATRAKSAAPFRAIIIPCKCILLAVSVGVLSMNLPRSQPCLLVLGVFLSLTPNNFSNFLFNDQRLVFK